MQKYKWILLSLTLILVSCKNYYLIDIENVTELRNAILESEKYMKKIEVLSTYPRFYVVFGGLDEGRIHLIYSTLNYAPNDSIREKRHDPNFQSHVNTLQSNTQLESGRVAKVKVQS